MSHTGWIASLLGEKKEERKDEALPALPVLVYIEDRKPFNPPPINVGKFTYYKKSNVYKLLHYLMMAERPFQFIAEGLLSKMLTVYDCGLGQSRIVAFNFFDLYSGNEYIIDDPTIMNAAFPTRNVLQIGNKLIAFGNNACTTYQLEKNKPLKVIDKFKTHFIPDGEPGIPPLIFADQQCIAFITWSRMIEIYKITIVDLKNHQTFAISPKVKESSDIAGIAIDENNHLFVFFNPKENAQKLQPSDRCIRYPLLSRENEKKEKVTVAGEPEVIDCDLPYENIQRVQWLSHNRIIIVGRERPLSLVSSNNVCDCVLKDKSIHLSKIIGKTLSYRAFKVFDRGNVLVFQDGETHELRVVTPNNTYAYRYPPGWNVFDITEASPNVACLTIEKEEEPSNIPDSVQFLQIPRRASRQEFVDVFHERLPLPLVSLTADYLGDDIWVDDGSPDQRLPFLGKDSAFRVYDVSILGNPAIQAYGIPGLFYNQTDFPFFNERKSVGNLEKINELKTTADLNQMLTEILLLLTQFLRVTRSEPPKPELVQFRKDLEDIIRYLNAPSGSFIEMFQGIIHKYQKNADLKFYLNQLLAKIKKFPDIQAREVIESKFELDMKKEDKFELTGHPETDRMRLNLYVDMFFNNIIENINEFAVRPRILLERMINWVKTCVALQKLEDGKRPGGLLAFLTSQPPSAASERFIKALKQFENLRAKKEEITLSLINDIFHPLTGLDNYEGRIKAQITTLANPLSLICALEIRAQTDAKAIAYETQALAEAARASAEVKASAKTKTPSPDEKKSATREAELERLLERVIKVKDSLYAEELFPEVYKWFEYAATFVRLEYNEIRSSGDAKAIAA